MTDARGAAAYATVPIRVEAPNTSCFGARSDNFDGTALDRDRWSTIVRENQTYSVAGGALRLPTQAADLYGTRADAGNIILQPTPAGAWQATTKVTLPLTANYQQAGLILYGDDANWAKLDLLFADYKRVEFIRQTASVPRNEAADSTPADTDTVFLRLTSDGTNLTAAYSIDGVTFTPAGRSAALAGIENPKIGLYAVNGGSAAPVVNAEFDWFQITPDEAGGEVVPSDEFDGSALDKCRWDAVVREDATAYQVAGGSAHHRRAERRHLHGQQHRTDQLHPAERAGRRLDDRDQGRRQPAERAVPAGRPDRVRRRRQLPEVGLHRRQRGRSAGRRGGSSSAARSPAWCRTRNRRSRT